MSIRKPDDSITQVDRLLGTKHQQRALTAPHSSCKLICCGQLLARELFDVEVLSLYNTDPCYQRYGSVTIMWPDSFELMLQHTPAMPSRLHGRGAASHVLLSCEALQCIHRPVAGHRRIHGSDNRPLPSQT
jgi:hypothetical protein